MLASRGGRVCSRFAKLPSSAMLWLAKHEPTPNARHLVPQTRTAPSRYKNHSAKGLDGAAVHGHRNFFCSASGPAPPSLFAAKNLANVISFSNFVSRGLFLHHQPQTTDMLQPKALPSVSAPTSLSCLVDGGRSYHAALHLMISHRIAFRIYSLMA